MKYVSENTLIRKLKNGLIIKGYYVKSQSMWSPERILYRLEMFVAHHTNPSLWCETLYYVDGVDHKAHIEAQLAVLDKDCRDSCIDQVPTTRTGMPLIEAMLSRVSALRGERRRVRAIA